MAWPGGKDGAGVYQRLINQIPPHDVFVSAFLGDCAIMRRKAPARLSIGIDRSRDNVDRWAVKSSMSDQARPDLRLYCCCGIEWLRHAFGLYLVGPHDPAAIDRPPLFPAAPAECSTDGMAAGSGGRIRTFVYLDPPYLLASRRSRRKLYEWELSDEQHVELLDTALRLPCLVMVSHYPHPLYARSLAAWRTFTFKSQTRGGKPAVEQVWMNYPPVTELHDARFVGGNKRERERVRRRVRNWVGGLDRMQPAERQAVLDQILGRYFPRMPRSPDSSAAAAI